MDSPIESLSPISLRNQAISVLRAQILIGALEAGRLYSVGEVADQLKVSPTPVREALLHLADEGLVLMVRNRGFSVREFDAHDLEELVECRLMLEVPMAGKLARGGRLKNLEVLRSLARRTEVAAEAGDMADFLASDREFHALLLSNSGNQRLVRMVGALRDQTRLYGLVHLRGSRDLLATAREHRQLLDLIDEGQAFGAKRLMRKHLLHTRGIWAAEARSNPQNANLNAPPNSGLTDLGPAQRTPTQ
ncbi:GntR family transcriptional regulator [Aminobacter carboxidus]|uniref:GntR family transcriptional regulator n=1 Tax=Aminobacter carboxidus TaxID=376165 RepID=A0ABR9GWB7_9HYPH|nr:GntR family transcriptional regulator [Aminobacter carboxidus]MBE1207970.1 GntR family transcriptional regulator [Aminobacter carboxidus]